MTTFMGVSRFKAGWMLGVFGHAVAWLLQQFEPTCVHPSTSIEGRT